MSEQDYINGSQAAWRAMFATCLRELGVDDVEAQRARWVLERSALVASLRQLCAEHGDNDWDDDLHLVDVLEKHLRID